MMQDPEFEAGDVDFDGIDFGAAAKIECSADNALDQNTELERLLSKRRANRLRYTPPPTRCRIGGLDLASWKSNRETRWRRTAFVSALPAEVHAH